ncbi:MAG TPA: hypothetical protein DCX21_01345 [Eubacterium sp.]|nr:hypothetical protein [Eubacterium sp.]
MKMINNMNIRLKLLVITLPLMICLVVSVIFAGAQTYHAKEKSSDMYYDTLYKVNLKLANADRDFYQAMLGASYYYDFVNGFSSLSGDELTEQKEAKLSEYKTNIVQAEERFGDAVGIAKKEKKLYKGFKSENGLTFEQNAEEFYKLFDEMKAAFDVEANTGDWTKFNMLSAQAREYLDHIQDITESWSKSERNELDSYINNNVAASGILFFAVIAGIGILVFVIVVCLTRSLRRVSASVDRLTQGDLTVTFPENISKDETGKIEQGVKNLSEKLGDIIGKAKKISVELTESGKDLSSSAMSVAQVSEQVTASVDEISKGAVSQSMNVNESLNTTEDIGHNIEDISISVKDMDSFAQSMKRSCDKAMDALDELIRQNATVLNMVNEIGKTIVSTNESTQAISLFTQTITDIASETNLLSLNASIEAARAGEAGKGFAVVAGEIRNLADQSKNSADEIQLIVDRLLEDSASSVKVLERLNGSFSNQSRQLDSTKRDMITMSEHVNSVKNTSAGISDRVNALAVSKNELIDVVENLSAISEENASLTEETNAVMQELNATFTLISESAKQLLNISGELSDTISYFNV